MDFKLHLENSWKIFTRFLPSLLIVTVVLIVVSIISFGIFAPVATAGYMQALLLAFRDGRTPEVKDLFSEMRLFLPLLGFSILVAIVLFFGFAMLVLPGLIMVMVLTFCCMYLLPLMTDQQLGLFEALQESFRMSLQQPVSEHIAVVAVYLLLTSLGGSVVFGVFFTTPFATLFILSVYDVKRTRLLLHHT